jgi:hypothetical protein
MNGSRFRDGRVQIAVWCVGSMKSGPTLKGWTTRPLVFRACMIPRDTVVLPQPL